MNAHSRSRRILGLLTMLSLSCMLLSACHYAVRTKTLFGDHRDQFPTIVLTADQKDTINYTFDWETTTVGGVSVAKFVPSSKFWRLNMFRFSNGERIGGNTTDFISTKDYPKVELKDLPTERLLRADFDFADDKEGTKDRDNYSFMVLFHYGD
jgi:hypothetical protein